MDLVCTVSALLGMLGARRVNCYVLPDSAVSVLVLDYATSPLHISTK